MAPPAEAAEEHLAVLILRYNLTTAALLVETPV
jgi:hypothetical protein